MSPDERHQLLELLAEFDAEERRARAFDDFLALGGTGEGAPSDVSANHDKYLAEIYADKHER